MLELFLKYLRFEKRYSDHTVSSYKIDLEQFVNFIKEELNLNDLSFSKFFSTNLFLKIKFLSISKTFTTKVNFGFILLLFPLPKSIEYPPAWKFATIEI